MKQILLVASATALLAACGSMPSGEAAPIAEAARAQSAPSSADYAMMAASSDQYEIQSSRLVLETSQDAGLRRFAEMMVEHHTMTTATLMRAVQADGMTPPPTALDVAKAGMIRDLRAATGQARDDLYKQQQVMAHREALGLHAAYAEGGASAALKMVAAAAVPIVSRHYNMIVGMAGAAM